VYVRFHFASFAQSKIEDNGGVGLLLKDEGSLQLTGTTIRWNGKAAIQLSGGTLQKSSRDNKTDDAVAAQLSCFRSDMEDLSSDYVSEEEVAQGLQIKIKNPAVTQIKPLPPVQPIPKQESGIAMKPEAKPRSKIKVQQTAPKKKVKTKALSKQNQGAASSIVDPATVASNSGDIAMEAVNSGGAHGEHPGEIFYQESVAPDAVVSSTADGPLTIERGVSSTSSEAHAAPLTSPGEKRQEQPLPPSPIAPTRTSGRSRRRVKPNTKYDGYVCEP
jgi:hypothetical protein